RRRHDVAGRGRVAGNQTDWRIAMSDELRECPFCGDTDNVELESLQSGRFAVECWSCFASIGSFDTPQQAVTNWNRRVPAPQAQAVPVEVPDAIDTIWHAANLFRIMMDAGGTSTAELAAALDQCKSLLDSQRQQPQQPEPDWSQAPEWAQ